MRSFLILAATLLVPLGAATNVEEFRFVGSGDTLVMCTDLVGSYPQGTAYPGGGCFLNAGVASVEVRDAAGRPVTARWEQRLADPDARLAGGPLGAILASGAFCGRDEGIPSPGPGGSLLVVIVRDVPDPACEPGAIGVGGPRAIAGTVVAETY